MTTRKRTLKHDQIEREILVARALQAFIVIAALSALLLIRFAYLQYFAHDQYSAKSEENRVRQNPIAPARGMIFDCNGVILAENRLAYRLQIKPEATPKGAWDMYQRVAQIIALDEDDRAAFTRELSQHRKFQDATVRLKLDEQELARLQVALYRLPGVSIEPYSTRFYPMRELTAHIVGYVGRIDARDEQRIEARTEPGLDPINYATTTHIGKLGIESKYETLLHGQTGYERVEVNAAGRTVNSLKRVDPIAGMDLYLSIDVRVQKDTADAFQDRAGAAVAIEPISGEIIAMVSRPSFDPNLYVNGISTKNYKLLMSDPLRPTFHRALSGTYPPGSTFKPFVGMAGLELGYRTAQDTVVSRGIFYLPNAARGYKDWRAGGHGVINLHEAMAQSVNTYFYKLALDMGIDTLHDYVTQFGFGAPTGIDLNGEASGLIPNKAWKRSVSKMPWFPGETVVCGIGQGQVSTTPLQLAVASATLAGGGIRPTPHLVMAMREPRTQRTQPTSFPPVNTNTFIKNVNHLTTMREAMAAVLHGPTGTARSYGRNLPFRIAGKTGTAQQVSHNAPRGADGKIDPRFRNQALFVGFAPAESPKLAVGLIVELGESGAGAAAPVGRKILESFLSGYAGNRAPMAADSSNGSNANGTQTGSVVSAADETFPDEQLIEQLEVDTSETDASNVESMPQDAN
jgi:penicillin-binding protein 2